MKRFRSPTPALPRREGAAKNRAGTSLCASPSLWGRAGVGLLGRVGVGLLLILCGCITEFEAKHTDDIADILVVEGLITDDESTIVLSSSAGLKDDNRNMFAYHVTGAKVYIECDDGMQWSAARQNYGEYTIENGKLNPEKQYRLKILVETGRAPSVEKTGNAQSVEKTGHAPSLQGEYHSEYAYPLITPEIDSVFWTKKDRGQPVNIHVATHATDSMVQYCRWSYREVWELKPQHLIEDEGKCPKCLLTGLDNKDVICPYCGFELTRFPYYCWNSASSKEMLLGSSEKTVSGRLTEILTKTPPSNERFSILYRMDVTQNAISKQAYNYYTNIKKNSQQSGGIMSHIPAELKGNIICVTEPGQKVIGYMDVASITRGRLYVYPNVYEAPMSQCTPKSRYEITLLHGYFPDWYYGLPGLGGVAGMVFVSRKCVDCTSEGASKYRPADWPENF